MGVIDIINYVITLTTTILLSYKIILGVIGLFATKRFPDAKINHTFAILIAGRNESKVIGQLIESIRQQNYDQSLLKIFFVADNCTDNTAEIVRNLSLLDGAEVNVYERFNQEKIGKGYALDFLLSNIQQNFPDYKPDGFLIFDADNLLDKNYIHEMNKVLDAGYDVSTSYRNSKNFDSNWISGCSSMIFLRECRFLHRPRAIINSSTFVSGTGFMVNSIILNTETGWKYTTLTEDIEFSTSNISKGKKITYCDDAVFYDEQPTTFKSSWNQRMRWQKGFYQCFNKYFGVLFISLFSKRWFATYEMIVMLFPFTVVTFFWGIFYYTYTFINNFLVTTMPIMASPIGDVLSGLLMFAVIGYISTFLYGCLILFMERKRVKAPLYKKFTTCLMFPIFIATYIPIAIVSMFKKVKWKQIPHVDSRTIDDIEERRVEEVK